MKEKSTYIYRCTGKSVHRFDLFHFDWCFATQSHNFTFIPCVYVCVLYYISLVTKLMYIVQVHTHMVDLTIKC